MLSSRLQIINNVKYLSYKRLNPADCENADHQTVGGVEITGLTNQQPYPLMRYASSYKEIYVNTLRGIMS